MFKKITLNQELKRDIKEDVKSLLLIITIALAMGVPFVYMMYRPFM